ncbi:Ctr copper transporter family-domain-containing protein [Zopfochytrium polystomum]|nr:Ctr copper transporter family-domain-containing protein [Zopfochytrium polystomum]
MAFPLPPRRTATALAAVALILSATSTISLAQSSESSLSSSLSSTSATASSASASPSSSTAASDALSAALTSLCPSPSTPSSLAVSACSMKDYCKSLGTTEEACSSAALLVDACQADGSAVPAVAALSSSSPTVCKDAETACASSSCGSAPTSLISSLKVQSNIFSFCALSSAAAQCSSCVRPSNSSQLASCDSLTVYGQICRTSPSTSACSDYTSLCSLSPRPMSLGGLCGGLSSATEDPTTTATSPSTTTTSTTTAAATMTDAMPMMTMYFHTGITEYILFESFVPTTSAQFAGAWLFCFLLAISPLAVAAARRKWVDKRVAVAKFSPIVCPRDGKPSSAPSAADAAPTRRSPFLLHFAAADASFHLHHAVKTLLRGTEVALSYLAMLVVMQFNVALFFAVVAGVVVGAWVFEWDVVEERDVLCCA